MLVFHPVSSLQRHSVQTTLQQVGPPVSNANKQTQSQNDSFPHSQKKKMASIHGNVINNPDGCGREGEERGGGGESPPR